jgi:hypothetical protein
MRVPVATVARDVATMRFGSIVGCFCPPFHPIVSTVPVIGPAVLRPESPRGSVRLVSGADLGLLWIRLKIWRKRPWR